ncbi:MAG: hypothetical protein AVDCRST_MAG59-966, partial [uncultured Thermomicrobiales bacterium]
RRPRLPGRPRRAGQPLPQHRLPRLGTPAGRRFARAGRGRGAGL